MRESIVVPPNRFISHHNHCGFSQGDGLDLPQDHIDFCKENGLDAWAMTDHGNMNGFGHAWSHVKKLNESGERFKLIAGVEAYYHPDLDTWKKDAEAARSLAPDDRRRKRIDDGVVTPLVATVDSNDETLDLGKDEAALTVENEEETKSSKLFDPVKRRHHLVVIPTNSDGLKAIFGLVSRSYTEGFYKFPRIDARMLQSAAKKGDFLLSTACVGGITAWATFQELQGISFDSLDWHLLDDVSLMDRIVRRIGSELAPLHEVVGENRLYLELQFNKLPAQHLANRALLEFARRRSLERQLIVTCDAHYSRPNRWKEREIYKALYRGKFEEFGPASIPKSKEELKCELYPKNAVQVWETYLSTTDGMTFYDDSLVSQACERTYDIAHHVIGDVQPDCRPRYPASVVPEGKTAIGALTELVCAGLKKKGLSRKKEYVDRAKTEIEVIKKKDFAEYFLTMNEIIAAGKDHLLIGAGRGSAAGSLVCYALGITGIDPIKYDLLFERFISLDRVGYPDIDTDVENRDVLLDLLREKFGSGSVVPISNYNTFKLKSLIRDISRFYSIPLEEVSDALRTVEREVVNAVKKAGDDKNLFVLTYEDSYAHSPSFRKFIDAHPEIAENVEVLFKQNRSLGRHAGGVLILDNPQDEMPLILARGEVQSPWVEGMNFKHLEALGQCKHDLLGLETLRIVHRTINLILKKMGRSRGRLEIKLDNGERRYLFNDQLVKTDRGLVRADELTVDDDIVEMPGLR